MWLLPDAEPKDYTEFKNKPSCKDILLGNKCIKCARAWLKVDLGCDMDEAVCGCG